MIVDITVIINAVLLVGSGLCVYKSCNVKDSIKENLNLTKWYADNSKHHANIAERHANDAINHAPKQDMVNKCSQCKKHVARFFETPEGAVVCANCDREGYKNASK